jgi:serine/threonine protein kinase
LAPELIRPDGYSGFKADMWSAGCLLHAMVVGSLPFPSSTIAELHE